MGRIRPAWYYERQAREANARQAYFRDREVPESADINSRGAATTVYYRSMILRDGSNHRTFSTSVLDSTLAIVSAANAGLLTTLGSGATASPLRRSGVRPNKALWYRGDATPRRVRTAWNTLSSRYHAPNSHRSIPLSEATGTVEPNAITTRFNQLFGSAGSARTALGGSNGRAHIQWERVSISAQT